MNFRTEIHAPQQDTPSRRAWTGEFQASGPALSIPGSFERLLSERHQAHHTFGGSGEVHLPGIL